MRRTRSAVAQALAWVIVCGLAGLAGFARQLEQPAAAATAVRPLLVGSQVPAVPVRTLDGETVDLRSTVTGKPTLLLFYRGGW